VTTSELSLAAYSGIIDPRGDNRHEYFKWLPSVSELVAAYHGLNVLDLSTRLSGAFAARLFGDYGADVILAEPSSGHTLRQEPPFALFDDEREVSPVHTYVNWNKRSKLFADLAELKEDISQADVVVTTDLATASKVGPWLHSQCVHLCVTAHGAVGSLSEVPGNNLTTSARTGWSYINRMRDEPPLQMPRHQSGYVGGIAGYIAASAALIRRSNSPEAERVDVSEVEAFAHTVHPWGIMSIYAADEDSYGPTGWRRRGTPGPLWDVGSGRIHLAIGDFHNWTEAMEALGLPEIGRDPILIPDLGRHGRDLKGVVTALGQALPKLDRWQVFSDLAKLRCVVGVMQNTNDLLADPQFAARDFLTTVAVKDKKVRTAGAPLKLSPAPWRLSKAAPPLSLADSNTAFSASAFKSTNNTYNAQSTQMAKERAGPLSGVRILSLGQAWSGTFGAEIFSLLGADVVQLGGIQRPDVWRRVRNEIPMGVYDKGKRQHPLNTSGLYNSVNLNKRELTLNLKDPHGMDLFWRLIPNFDILIDNFRSTVMPSWGVTLEKLHTLRPGAIWASISGYGTEGPYSDYPANGASTEPMSGFSSLHGYAGDPGMNTAGLYPDPTSGYLLATGIMAALHHRDRTGEPQRVDLAMMEAVTSLCGDALIEYQLTDELPRPMGNRHPRFAPHNNFPCHENEWLALAVETDQQWQTLANLVGEPLNTSDWCSLSYRKSNEEVLETVLAAWCQNQSAHALEEKLSQAGIPAARIMPLYELYTDTSSALHETGFIQEVIHPEAGPSLLPGYPWHFSGSDEPGLHPSPCVGEHSQEILREELGMEETEYRSLVASGITGTLSEHEQHYQNS
jgi:crotonobetainyl-CoA:carnitine CoA-transferase CaiB-like acyl-CoA transferase